MLSYDFWVAVGLFLFLLLYICNLRPRAPISWELLEFQRPYFVCMVRPKECEVWPTCIKVQDCDQMSLPFNILAPPEEVLLLHVDDLVWVDRNGSGKLIFRAIKKPNTSILD